MFNNVDFYSGNSSYNNFLSGFRATSLGYNNWGIGLNNTNFIRPYQPFIYAQQPFTPAAVNQPYANQNFEEFCAKAYKGIPDRTTTSADKEKAILAKISILNHPQCPPELKAELYAEIGIINGELRTMDNNPSKSNENFDAFVERMYNGIPDRTSTVPQKQKAILAKVAIMNHPQCPPDSKPVLMQEISIINNEIMQMKSNCNTKV